MPGSCPFKVSGESRQQRLQRDLKISKFPLDLLVRAAHPHGNTWVLVGYKTTRCLSEDIVREMSGSPGETFTLLFVRLPEGEVPRELRYGYWAGILTNLPFTKAFGIRQLTKEDVLDDMSEETPRENLDTTTRKGICQYPQLNQKILFPFLELWNRCIFQTLSSLFGFGFCKEKEQQTQSVRICIKARENEFR